MDRSRSLSVVRAEKEAHEKCATALPAVPLSLRGICLLNASGKRAGRRWMPGQATQRACACCTAAVHQYSSGWCCCCHGHPPQAAALLMGMRTRRECKLAKRDFQQLGAVVRLIDYWTGSALAEQQLVAAQQLLTSLLPPTSAHRLATVRPPPSADLPSFLFVLL